LTSNFLESFLVLTPNFQRGEIARFDPGTDPANRVRGAISAIFVSQVSWRVQYFKRDEVYFTTLLWQNNGWQNGLVVRMLFYELYTLLVNTVNSQVLGRAIASIVPPGFTPVWRPCGRPWLWRTTSSKLFAWVQRKSTRIAIIVILFACTCLPTMLTSKLTTEIIENYSEF